MQLAETSQQCDYLLAEKDKLEHIVSQLTSELQQKTQGLPSAPKISEIEHELRLKLTNLSREFQTLHENWSRLQQELAEAKSQLHSLQAVRSSTSIHEQLSEASLRKQIAELNQQCQRLYSEKA